MEWRIVYEFGPKAVEEGWGFWPIMGIIAAIVSGYFFMATLLYEAVPKHRWPDDDRDFAFLWPFIMFYILPALLAGVTVELGKRAFTRTRLPKAKVHK